MYILDKDLWHLLVTARNFQTFKIIYVLKKFILILKVVKIVLLHLENLLLVKETKIIIILIMIKLRLITDLRIVIFKQLKYN